MAKKLLTAYTFTPGAANAGTVVVSGTYALEQFLLITNVTTGATVYQFNKATKGGAVSTGGGNTTLTLEADTSAMSGSDRLQVFVDDASAVAVSAASLPLPSGASTSALQTTANASLNSIDGKLPALSSGRVPVDVGSSINVGEVEIKNDTGNPVPVTATSLPLPTGAATTANQTTANTSLANIDTDLGAQADAAATSDTGTFGVIALIKRGLQNWTTLLGRVPSLTVSSTRLLVDGSGVTQPVSGPLTDTQLRASAVNVAPNITRGSGVADANTQRVTLASDGPAVTALTSIDGKTPALVSGRQPVDGSGVTQPISAASLPLPTGAATETTLSSVNTKLPSLVSGSLPVLVQNGQLEIQNDTGNPIPVGPAATQTLSGSASANNTDLFSVDCSAFRSINFQITGTWVGTISFQVSNDNTTWNSLGLYPAGASTTIASSATANGAWFGTFGGFNFVRLRFTAYTSGTATVAGFLLREPVVGMVPTGSAQNTIGTTTTSASSTAPYTVNSAATTNAASIKASGANLYGMSIMNASASTKYVRFYNKASAPTVGTDVPIMVVAVPATSSKEIEYVPAMRFGTGLAVAITGGAAVTDSTAVAAGDVQLMVSYA